jgi:hypothetical protein
VYTGARALNTHTADPVTTFTDLERGRFFGQYTITDTPDPGTIVRLPLNRRAVSIINERAGHFFSIGGTLAHDPEADPCAWSSLFGGSSSLGKQRLVLRTTSPTK